MKARPRATRSHSSSRRRPTTTPNAVRSARVPQGTNGHASSPDYVQIPAGDAATLAWQAAEKAARDTLHGAAQQHRVEVLQFAGDFDVFADGEGIVRRRTGTAHDVTALLSAIAQATRSFTVVVHDHTTLAR